MLFSEFQQQYNNIHFSLFSLFSCFFHFSHITKTHYILQTPLLIHITPHPLTHSPLLIIIDKLHSLRTLLFFYIFQHSTMFYHISFLPFLSMITLSYHTSQTVYKQHLCQQIALSFNLVYSPDSALELLPNTSYYFSLLLILVDQ